MFDFNISMPVRPDDSEVYDVIIIGGGPAGLTAGLYASRYKLRTLMIEKMAVAGGQLTATEWVENYPGFPEPVLGQKLAQDMEKQAKAFGMLSVNEDVTKVDLHSNPKLIYTPYGTWKAKTVLIATGASPRTLGLAGEEEYKSKGVSYCATCDGPFYANKDLAVVGGGNTAYEESLFLAKYASKIYLLQRGEQSRADKLLQQRVRDAANIELITCCEVIALHFDDAQSKHITIKDISSGDERDIPVEGLFIFIGSKPNTELFAGQIELHDGYIVADDTHQTSVTGVWSAGDVEDKVLRQVATAVGDGACAAYWINKYLTDNVV